MSIVARLVRPPDVVVGAALGFAAVLVSVNFKNPPLSETTKKSVIKVIPHVRA